MIHGSGGSAEYLSIEFDPQGNILASGSVFVNAIQRAYFEYFYQEGVQVYSYIVDSFDYLEAPSIKIQDGGATLFAAVLIQARTTVTKSAFLMIDYTTGKALKQYEFSRGNLNSIYQNAMVYQINGYLTYANKQNNGSYAWELYTFDLTTGSYSLLRKSTSSLGTQAINVVVDQNSSKTVVQGVVDGSFYLSFFDGLGLTKSSITNLKMPSGDYNKDFKVAKSLSAFNDGSSLYVSQCYNNLLAIGWVMFIAQARFNIATQQIDVARDFSVSDYNCAEIFAVSQDEVFIAIWEYLSLFSHTLVVGKYNFATSQMETHTIKGFQQTSLTVNAAAIRSIINQWSLADILIIGQTSRFNGDSYSGGFITPVDSSAATCIQRQSLSTWSKGNSGFSISIQAIAFSSSSGSLVADSLPLVRRDQRSSSLSLTCSVNSQTYSLMSQLPLPTINYYMGTFSRAYTIDFAQVNPTSCTDGKILYDYISPLVVKETKTPYNIQLQVSTNDASFVSSTKQVQILQMLVNNQIFTRTFNVNILSVTSSPCQFASFSMQFPAQKVLKYVINDPPLFEDFKSQVQTNDSSCGFEFRLEADSLSYKDPDIFYENFTSQLLSGLTIFTTNQTKNQTYKLLLYSYIIDSTTQIISTLDIHILDDCGRAKIPPFFETVLTHDIYYAPDTIDLSDWTHNMSSNSNCPKIVIELYSPDSFEIPSTFALGIFSASPTSQLTLDSNTLASVQEHLGYYFKAQYYMQGIVIDEIQHPFLINITAVCYGATLSQNEQVPPISYVIGDPLTIFSFSGFTSSVNECIAIRISSISSPSTSVVYGIDFTNLTFLVETQNLGDEGIYNITIEGKLPNLAMLSYNITLEVTNPCRDLQFSYPEESLKYRVDYFSMIPYEFFIPIFDIDPLILVPPVCNQPQILSVVNETNQSLPIAMYSFSPSSQILTLQSGWNPQHCLTTDTLKVQMTLSTMISPVTKFGTFKIEYDCRCDKISVTSTGNYTFNYLLGDSGQAFSFIPFTKNNSVCPNSDILYSLTQSSDIKAQLFTSLLSPDNALSPGTINSQLTMNYNLAGNYIIKLTGSISNGLAYAQADSFLTFTAIRGCNLPEITVYPSVNSKDFKYLVNRPALNIVFPKWQIAQTFCGAFSSYTLTPLITSTSTLPISIALSNLNISHSEISLQTSDKSINDVFEWELRTSLAASTHSFTEIFRVKISNCSVTHLQPGHQKLIYSYLQGQGDLYIAVLPFIPNEDCDYPIKYSLKVERASDLRTVNMDSIVFKEELLAITINSFDPIESGTYNLVIEGILVTEESQSVYNSVTFKIDIITPDNTPPYFITEPLEVLQVKQGSSFTYVLPTIQDKQGDLVIIRLANFPSFVSLVENRQSIEIKPTNQDQVGEYLLQIILRDNKNDFQNNQKPTETTYNLKVEIVEQISDIQFQMMPQGKYLKMTDQTFELEGKKIERKKLTGKMKAEVSEISQIGIIKIKFDTKLIKLEDTDPLVYFDALQFYLHSYQGNTSYLNDVQRQDDSKKRRIMTQNETAAQPLNFSANWKVTSFEEDEISISLDFDDPKGISNREEFDELSIDFNGRYFFVSEDMTKVMPSRYQIKTQVPPQLENDDSTQALEMLASATNTALTGTITINFILALILGISLKKLWMLIQTLQIIVHLPLLNISLPANVLLTFKTLVEISNLNFIPKAEIKKLLSGFINDKASSAKQNFQQLDIFQRTLDSNPAELVSTILMAFYVIMTPFIAYLFLSSYVAKLSTQSFIDKFGTLYLNLNEDDFICLLQVVLFFLRRLVFAFSIVYFASAPFLQASIQICWSLALVMYVSISKPYKSKMDNFFEIFNEFTLLTISYFLIIYIQIVNDPEMRYNIGWYIIIGTLFNILVNWLNLICTVIHTIYIKIKLKLAQRKASKASKQPQENFEDGVDTLNELQLENQRLGKKKMHEATNDTHLQDFLAQDQTTLFTDQSIIETKSKSDQKVKKHSSKEMLQTRRAPKKNSKSIRRSIYRPEDSMKEKLSTQKFNLQNFERNNNNTDLFSEYIPSVEKLSVIQGQSTLDAQPLQVTNLYIQQLNLATLNSKRVENMDELFYERNTTHNIYGKGRNINMRKLNKNYYIPQNLNLISEEHENKTMSNFQSKIQYNQDSQKDSNDLKIDAFERLNEIHSAYKK